MKFFYTIICLLLLINVQATVRRVKTTGSAANNGLSWAAAMPLQTAINASVGGDTVWVAAGIYYSSEIGTSFSMKSGVKIYGGFAGTETLFSQRDFKANVTSLYGYGASVISNVGVNNGALIDGVTIARGAASSGGGMYNFSSAPIISNVIFNNNGATNAGGGMWNANGNPTLINVVFKNNNAGTTGSGTGTGGGIYNDEAYPSLTNVVFDGNTAGKDGGGMHTYSGTFRDTRKPILTNVVFYNNKATNGVGGAVFNELCSAVITNCTFLNNYSTLAGAGGAIQNYSSSGTSPLPAPVITNCIFVSNYVTVSGISTAADVGTSNANPTYNYCAFSQTTTPSGTGNINISQAAIPFLNSFDPDGADDTWMTADDGVQLDPCSGKILMDKGDNSAISATTDILGLSRKWDNPLITDAGSGTAPIVDLGAYENHDATTVQQLTGIIAGGHTVPIPQELKPDFITNATSPTGITVRWQKSENGGASFSDAQVVSRLDSLGYRLPALTTTTLFRRSAASGTYCNTTFYSDTVTIKVVNPNGAITGRVISKNGTPVKDIVIRAQRTTPVSGSPNNYAYYDTTKADGTFSITPVYYGDPGIITSSATFRVTPLKTNHGFNFAYLDKTLTQNIPQQQNVNFTDTTVFGITGRTYQQCNGCITNLQTLATGLQTCPLDSVSIYSNNLFYSYTTYIDTAYGRYAVSVTDPGLVRIEPRYNSHVFSPAFTNVNVTDNVAGIDFRDTTVHTISGKLSDGCGNYIGGAVLEFTDMLPNDKDGNARTSCFRRRVTTNPGSGTYSITLPPRKYMVSVINFTSSVSSNNPAYIFETDVKDFFNNRLPKDSLTRDITTRDTTLNLKFIRTPKLQIVYGLDTMCNGVNRGYALFRQAITDSFAIRVYQGDPSIGCLVTDTTNKIIVTTSIPSLDNTNQTRSFNPSDAGVVVRLAGGTPNIITPYYKPLNIRYNDLYSRPLSTTQIDKNVIVTGVKTDVATFTTVSPEIPLLVLHDPPGDNSYSTWQSSNAIQNAFRIYAASSNNTNIWLEAKIGTKFQAGLGITTETNIWGSINGSVNIGSTNTSGNETILTTTTTSSFSTSASPTVTGADGDVYIGAAFNLIYAGATEIKDSGCAISRGRRLVVANDSFATQYIYTEEHIKNTVIPTLNQLALNPGNTTVQAANYLNQARVWQQALDNNAVNKSRASFDKNISFDGSAGPITNSTTTSVSKASTVEFSMNIDATIAASLGLEIAGSGVSGGVAVNFKTETGSSNTNTVTKETTIGYTLDDDDNGDYFSVNVKKDPVYSTPVFELTAGTASCPAEDGAQPRDEMQLTVPVPAVTGVPANGEAQFVLKLGNTSQSGEARTYQLSFDQSSNPNGAIVTIGGSPVLTPIPYTIGYLGEVNVTVTVKKSVSSNVFSYEGLRFLLTDNCGGDTSKAGLISAYFVNNCSDITLADPGNNWVLTSAASNLLPVLLKDYTAAGLNTITLEYSPAGTSNWVTGFTKTAAQLNPNGANGTSVFWNVQDLPDGAYNLRVKLNCAQGVVYSQRATGTIDRKAPALFGIPEPTDDNYVTGDRISFGYDEKLDVSNLNNGRVTMRRLSNSQLIPITVSGYDNRIVVVPATSLAGFSGDSVRVVVTGIADQYGNIKAKNDTSRFILGQFIAATGNNALNLSVTNPTVNQNSDSTFNVYFNLPVNAPNDVRVNYSVSGTGVPGKDYNPMYNGKQPSYTSFTGTQGTIVIPAGSKQAFIRLKPRADSTLQPAKTIVISLTEGGDYALGANNSVNGQIISDDGISTYTFIGDGDFNVKSNWVNGNMPLSTLISGKEIIINPSGVCNLTGSLTVQPGAKITVKQGKPFVISGNLDLK